mgnify:CR=1 FL=1
MIYSQELKDRTFKAYEEDVSNGVVRQRELEEKVLMYYRRTTPSLQEYYSRFLFFGTSAGYGILAILEADARCFQKEV